MKCPHCEKEIPGSPCPKCGEMVFEDANYCMACGDPLKEELEGAPRDEDVLEDDDGSDFEDRVLCPDGMCTGIIIDGKCTECGKTEEEAAALEDQEEAPAVEPEKTDQEKKEEKGE
ncbi:MAG: hypothetical protein H8E10_19205 [Desulfobacterales bacterium]|nr:hypothetical protein [Desulfobacterales bacterium]MBL7173517.1 hypothetical protein [Desulfobacteraceae bacterium]